MDLTTKLATTSESDGTKGNLLTMDLTDPTIQLPENVRPFKDTFCRPAQSCQVKNTSVRNPPP